MIIGILSFILLAFFIYHLWKVRYYKEAINELLRYIDEEEI